MTTGIILAGGRGSRLGPLAAQISKALVSVGQQPHLAHQLEIMRRSNIDRVIVVTSPDTNVQVSMMLMRAGFPIGDTIMTVVQPEPMGPVQAIGIALEAAPLEEDVVVLMSDTYIDEVIPDEVADWVGVAPAPTMRSFCFWDEDQYVDATAPVGQPVTIGVYRFSDAETLYNTVASVYRRGRVYGEVGMAPLLTAYNDIIPVLETDFPTWQDLGDVRALAKARRSKFISREQHTLTLSALGVITKHGEGEDFAKQALWMAEVDADDRVSPLVPKVWLGDTDGQYAMEYVDLPTLSELWLYWPGRPDTWQGMVDDTLGQISELWKLKELEPFTPQEEFTLYAGKAAARVTEYDRKHQTQWSFRTTELMRGARARFVENDLAVFGHGDLNWNNILYSMNSGTVKLIDPRGDSRLPLSYELAKMRYSYHGGFSAITHGLFTAGGALMPNRVQEAAAVDSALVKWGHGDLGKLQACEAMLLLAGSAMHKEDEAEAMLARGCYLLEEIQ